MPIDLTPFWQALEQNFPPGGTRVELSDLFGPDLVAPLEAAEILIPAGEATRYPCPSPGGLDCPRRVVEGFRDPGSYLAVCGNRERECDDVRLTASAIELLSVDPARLCRDLWPALLIGGRVEQVDGIPRTWHAGVLTPTAGVGHPVFLCVQTSDRAYALALDALRSRFSTNCAVLVPTRRFFGVDLSNRMNAAGVPVIPLAGLVDLDDERLISLVAHPEELFAGIGRTGGLSKPQEIVARAVVDGIWQQLDADAYRDLTASLDFHILADALARRAVHRFDGGIRKEVEKIRPSHFRVLLKAVLKDGSLYDPGAQPPVGIEESGKQVFQRARQQVDCKVPRGNDGQDWALFPSSREADGTHYRFRPAEGIRYALIFFPE